MTIERAESTTQGHGSRRVAERRGRVYEAAIRLFVEQGYENTTMDDIAARSDVARASVFNYYQRKGAFLDEWSERRRAQAADAVSDIHPGQDETRVVLARYLTVLAQVSESSRIETVALMGAAIHSTNVLGHPELARALTPYMERAMRRSELRPGARAPQAALLLATGYFATLAAWIDSDPPPFILRDALVEMLDFVLGGIFVPSSHPTA